jgi:hypothetical protein
MDSQRFDAVTRRFATRGSRRRIFAAFLAGSVGHLIPGSAVMETVAACKGYGANCSSGSPCCPNAGLTCRKQGKHSNRRCRCKQGWKHCSGANCLPVQSDPDNCGDCGHHCPANKPCCIGGTCQPRCGDTCCADCFVEILLNGNPDLDHPVCCEADGGTICGPNKKKQSDDHCCYPDQECVKGVCCCDGCEGAVVCGNRCCAEAACCDGECCAAGKVCATTTDGPSCVSAHRQCGPGEPSCLSGEVCHGGVCCSGNRVCGDGMGNDVCCDPDEYCEFPNSPIAECCPINTICKGTYRGHRVRR